MNLRHKIGAVVLAVGVESKTGLDRISEGVGVVFEAWNGGKICDEESKHTNGFLSAPPF